MPLISRWNEFMKERELTPTKVRDAVIKTGEKISYTTIHGFGKGNLPSTKTSEKICDAVKCQQIEFILWEE